MLKSLLSTSSLNLINITLVSFGLLSTNIAKGEETVSIDQYATSSTNATDSYGPSFEISSRNSKKRNLIELDYMQPVVGDDLNLTIVDLKLKADNKKSKEVNLGGVYRHNFDDNFIFGVYGYYDYRKTSSGLSVSGFTPGVEVLSKYIDVRANYYLPQARKKKTKHNDKKKIKIQGTSIYAVSGGHTYEYALRGYDFEIGTSVFAFSDDLNEKLGTKFFAAHYDFSSKHTKHITGNRFRFEQNIGRLQLGDNSLQFKLNGETQYDKARKRQNFIGIGAKFTFDDKTKKTGLRARMMDTVIRDVDIVTQSQKSPEQISSFMLNGRKVDKIYYVGGADANYIGDGTRAKPFSIEQFKKINSNEAIVVVTQIDQAKGGRAITSQEFKELKNMPQVVNGQEKLVLTSDSPDQVKLVIEANKGIKIFGQEGAVIESDIKLPRSPEKNAVVTSAPIETSSITLVAEPITQQEIICNNLDRENQQQEQIREQAAEQARVATAEEAERQRLAQAARTEAQNQQRVEAQRQAGINRAEVAERRRQEQQSEANRLAEQNANAQENTDVQGNAQNANAQDNINNDAENAQREALNAQREQALANVTVADPANPFNSGVNLATLTPAEQELQNYILEVIDTRAAAGSEAANREPDYQAALAIYNNSDLRNTSVGDRRNSQTIIQARVDRRARLDQLIDADPNYNPAQKARMKAFTEHMTYYVEAETSYLPHQQIAQRDEQQRILQDGNVIRNAINDDQNVGMSQTDAIDISVVASLQRMRDHYGQVDGVLALDLIERMARNITINLPAITDPANPNRVLRNNQVNVGNIDNLGNIDVPVAYTNAFDEYIRIFDEYNVIRRNYPLVGGVYQVPQDVQRQYADRMQPLARTLDLELNRGASRVNTYAAAVRQIQNVRRNNINGVDAFWIDHVTGRNNAAEIMGTTLYGVLDTVAVQKAMIEANIPRTPLNIFRYQVSKLQDFTQMMGEGFRGYNRNDDHSRDDGRQDEAVCRHGQCTRWVTSLEKYNDLVVLNNFTTDDFGGEIIKAFDDKFARLPAATKTAVQAEGERIYGNRNQSIEVTTNKKFIFKVDNQPVAPAFNQFMGEIAEELQARYQFLNNDVQMQMIKKNTALEFLKGSFTSFEY